MAYSISIVRKNDWDDPDEQSNITLEEWLSYIATDEELEHPAESSLTEYNRDYYKKRPGYCEWTAHSAYKEPFARPWFDYCKGDIDSQNVDDETLLKMISIAEQLNARVRGQDGELYDEDDAMNVTVKHDYEPTAQPPVVKKPWWKFW